MPAKTAKKVVRKTAKKAAGRSATKSTFTYTAVMAELRKQGTAQNRKVYARHGITGDVFGVPYSFMRPFAKKIGTNHDLAESLWASDNHDARMLACMIADGDQMTSARLNDWLRDVDNYAIADAFGGVVARSPHAIAKIKSWTKQNSEYTRRCGYNVLSSVLHHEREVPIELVKELLARIEKEIHTSENWAKESMNRTLISIGTYIDGFEKPAIAAAKRIGTVEVDHGQTGCKTPDAAPYIAKAVAHRKKMAAKRK